MMMTAESMLSKRPVLRITVDLIFLIRQPFLPRYCPVCKEHQEATKEMSLWQLPDILIVQLKRFSFKNYLWRDKLDVFVDFPVKYGLPVSIDFFIP